MTAFLRCSGPCLTMMPVGFVGSSHWLAQQHGELSKLTSNKPGVSPAALRAVFGNHPHRAELFLVPIKALRGTLSKLSGSLCLLPPCTFTISQRQLPQLPCSSCCHAMLLDLVSVVVSTCAPCPWHFGLTGASQLSCGARLSVAQHSKAKACSHLTHIELRISGRYCQLP